MDIRECCGAKLGGQGRSSGIENTEDFGFVLSAAAASSEEFSTLLNPPIGAVSLTCKRATSDLRLAIDNAQQCAHGAVEFASPLLVRLHRPRRNSEKALELLSGGCNLQADGLDLGRGHRAAWEVMRFQLDFAAQMLGHFFEGRDKIIADARTLGARSALGEPIAFPALSFQLNGSTAAISWRFVWQRHC